MEELRESDWRLLRRLQPIALDRFCRSVLSEVESACRGPGATAHGRFLNVFELIRDRDAKMAVIFDDVKRSNAARRLALMRHAGLLTDEEFAGFSEEVRGWTRRA